MRFKQIFLVICLFVCILTTLTGCGNINSDLKASQKQTPPKINVIEKLEVWSAAQNDDHIYHVDYPHHFYYFASSSGDMVAGHLEDLENNIPAKEMTSEEYAFFIDYVTGLPTQEKTEASVFSYRIYIRYYDENGERQSGFFEGYDTFPPGWEEFITRYNHICGGEYLIVNNTIQEVTPEFLTEVFGVTDDDVKDGTLQDVIDTQELNLVKITELFNMEAALNAYYASTKEELLLPYRPAELQMLASTQEEYNHFVEAYLERLGTDKWEEAKSSQAHLRYLKNTASSEWLYIGRTADLESLSLTPPANADGYYCINLDAHMEGMTYSADFIYSADGKYFLVYEVNDPDILLPFVQE